MKLTVAGSADTMPGAPPPVLVQKFGGSSLDGVEKVRRAAGRVLEACRDGYRVVVVVSAPGGLTDQLLGQAREISSHPNPRELDVLLSTGEQISIALMAMALEAEGQPALSLTGLQAGIHTDPVHGKAKILRVDPVRVKEALAQGRVVVVAGFQGVDDHADITTLGRGGSDLTAVALAAALKAEACEIFTDVDGVYTADPRIVPEARRLDAISHGEMLELASLGARVMQARSIEYAMRLGVTLRVRSTQTGGPGTWIQEDAHMNEIPVVTGVTCDLRTVRITVRDVPDAPGTAHRLFAAVAERHVNVDLIIQSAGEGGQATMSFTVPEDEGQRALEAAQEAARVLGAGDVAFDPDVAKVSVVGAGMMTTPGVAAQMFGALGEAGINIQMIGCSEIKVSCVVARDQGDEAVRVLHRAFRLDKPSATSP